MADLEAVLADVSYLMAMEKSKCTPAARQVFLLTIYVFIHLGSASKKQKENFYSSVRVA